MPHRIAAAGLLLALLAGPAAAQDWLAICAKCIAPSVFSKSGIGTANAVAEARVTEADARGWCENWQPGTLAACVRDQLASAEARRTYRAAANCPAGRITAIDGQTYTLAGTWPAGDIGAGRSRWKDARGRIVGRDNASGGLGISQQWEVLCPKARPAASRPVAPPPVAEYRVGQAVEARYGSAWVAARITAVRQTATARGPRIEYDVILANGRRGIVPGRMLRTPVAR